MATEVQESRRRSNRITHTPARYREDDIEDLPPNPIFALPTIPYNPYLPPAAFPTVPLGTFLLTPQVRARVGAREAAPASPAIIWKPMKDPMREATDKLKEKEGELVGAGSWEKRGSRVFLPVLKSHQWLEFSDGAQLVLMRELVRQNMDTTSIGIFLEIEHDALTGFAELVVEEIQNIALLQDAIDRANRAGIAVLDRRGCLLEWDRRPCCMEEWQASQDEAFANIPVTLSHRITRNEVQAMKEFLKTFHTIEDYEGWLHSFDGPNQEVYGNATEAIPSKAVVDEVCRRLDWYRGRKITFEQLAWPEGWDHGLLEAYGPPVPEVEVEVQGDDGNVLFDGTLLLIDDGGAEMISASDSPTTSIRTGPSHAVSANSLRTPIRNTSTATPKKPYSEKYRGNQYSPNYVPKDKTPKQKIVTLKITPEKLIAILAKLPTPNKETQEAGGVLQDGVKQKQGLAVPSSELKRKEKPKKNKKKSVAGQQHGESTCMPETKKTKKIVAPYKSVGPKRTVGLKRASAESASGEKRKQTVQAYPLEQIVDLSAPESPQAQRTGQAAQTSQSKVAFDLSAERAQQSQYHGHFAPNHQPNETSGPCVAGEEHIKHEGYVAPTARMVTPAQGRGRATSPYSPFGSSYASAVALPQVTPRQQGQVPGQNAPMAIMGQSQIERTNFSSGQYPAYSMPVPGLHFGHIYAQPAATPIKHHTALGQPPINTPPEVATERAYRSPYMARSYAAIGTAYSDPSSAPMFKQTAPTTDTAKPAVASDTTPKEPSRLREGVGLKGFDPESPSKGRNIGLGIDPVGAHGMSTPGPIPSYAYLQNIAQMALSRTLDTLRKESSSYAAPAPVPNVAHHIPSPAWDPLTPKFGSGEWTAGEAVADKTPERESVHSGAANKLQADSALLAPVAPVAQMVVAKLNTEPGSLVIMEKPAAPTSKTEATAEQVSSLLITPDQQKAVTEATIVHEQSHTIEHDVPAPTTEAFVGLGISLVVEPPTQAEYPVASETSTPEPAWPEREANDGLGAKEPPIESELSSRLDEAMVENDAIGEDGMVTALRSPQRTAEDLLSSETEENTVQIEDEILFTYQEEKLKGEDGDVEGNEPVVCEELAIQTTSPQQAANDPPTHNPAESGSFQEYSMITDHASETRRTEEEAIAKIDSVADEGLVNMPTSPKPVTDGSPIGSPSDIAPVPDEGIENTHVQDGERAGDDIEGTVDVHDDPTAMHVNSPKRVAEDTPLGIPAAKKQQVTSATSSPVLISAIIVEVPAALPMLEGATNPKKPSPKKLRSASVKKDTPAPPTPSIDEVLAGAVAEEVATLAQERRGRKIKSVANVADEELATRRRSGKSTASSVPEEDSASNAVKKTRSSIGTAMMADEEALALSNKRRASKSATSIVEDAGVPSKKTGSNMSTARIESEEPAQAKKTRSSTGTASKFYTQATGRQTRASAATKGNAKNSPAPTAPKFRATKNKRDTDETPTPSSSKAKPEKGRKRNLEESQENPKATSKRVRVEVLVKTAKPSKGGAFTKGKKA